jgi:hypothetical protein
MSIRSRIADAWHALTRAGGPAGYGMGVAWSGGPLYADAFGAKRGPSPTQLIEGYKQIAFACTEFNALGVSALNLRLYAASGQGMERPRAKSRPRSVLRREADRLAALPYVRRNFSGKDVQDVHEITNHPLLDTIERPAVDPDTDLSYFDRTSLIATLVRYLDIVGIGYLKPENANGVGLRELVAAEMPPTHLWPLQSQYVRPIRTSTNALIQKFGYFDEEYKPGDLTYIRLRPSIRDPYGAGYAAAQAAWQYSGLEDKGISMWDQLLGSGARPNAVMSPSDPLTPLGDDERKRLDGEMNTYHARGRAGRMVVLSVPMKLEAIKYPGFDTGEMEINNYNMQRMCNCWGVPVSFMSSETNLANFQAGRTFHAQFGIEPRAQCIASALTDLTRKYDPRLFWAFDGAIGEDKLQEATIIDMQVKSGLITWNQANADSPWPPRPDGDQVYIPGTLTTTDMIAEQHKQGLASAQAADKAGAMAAQKPPGKPGEKRTETGGQESAVLRRAERVLERIERELKS